MITTIIIIIFFLGYAAIALEHPLKLNKAVPALLTAAFVWIGATVLISANTIEIELTHHVSEIAQIVFFLMGAMTIVELIDAHDGFNVITDRIKMKKKSSLLIVVAILAFFLSAILDNLTTTIVMLSVSRKILQNKEDRWIFAGMIIIAANAGGAWSPIGDVTTTMLWIGKQITDIEIIKTLFIPSLVALVVPLTVMALRMKGVLEVKEHNESKLKLIPEWEGKLVLGLGLLGLISVPVFKKLTHLPPFLGMLFALAILWLVTEMLHKKKEIEVKKSMSIESMLTKIDLPTLLFFMGILLAVSGLQTIGILNTWATFADNNIPNKGVFLTGIGALSSVIDNIPVVKAVQSMYPLSLYPTDHSFWDYLAYAAGTGGSILIIGSAAGVAAMSIEKELSFGWYVKYITPYAILSYLSGAAYFFLIHSIGGLYNVIISLLFFTGGFFIQKFLIIVV